MNIEKFTQKSVEALQGAQTMAADNGNNSIEEEHLLAALLSKEDGLCSEIIKNIGASPRELCNAAERAVAAFPKVSGS